MFARALLFVALSLAVCVSAESDDVLDLKQDSFDEALKANQNLLVEFYAPWCGHCKSLAPKYSEAAKILKEKGVNGALAKVDCTKEEELAQRFSIQGFPTLILFKDGQQFKEYDSGRSAEALVEFMEKAAANELAADPEGGEGEGEGEEGDDEGDWEDEFVTTLSDDSFAEFISSRNLVIAEFYAPWCGHCKMLRPEYASAAAALKDNQNVAFVKIDATKNRNLAAEFGIEGFPTIKVFLDGKNVGDYAGERTADSLVKFAERSLRDAIVVITTEEEVKNAIATDEALVFGLFTQDSEQKTVFFNTANELKLEFSFFLVSDAALFSSVGGNDGNVVVYADVAQPSETREEKSVLQTDSSTTVESLENFIRLRSLPLFGAVNQDTFSQYSNSGKKLLMLVLLEREGADFKFIKEVAERARDKDVLVGYLDAVESPEITQELGISEGDLPVIVLDYENEQHFVFGNRERTHDAVLEFVDGVNSGSVQAHIRSAPAPESNDQPVKVVVGSTFADMVYRDEQDVLVEFFAPWCGHCKKLKPKYEKVAQLLSSVPSIVVASFDVSENDPPKRDEFALEGIPTIFLVRKDGKIIKYEGDRSTKGILSFVHENASESFTLPELGEEEESVEDPFEGLDLEAFQAMFANEFENELDVDADVDLGDDLEEVADERRVHEDL